MTSYRGLAGVYDYLVSGVDFEGWADYVEEILRRFGCSPKRVLDLACGTGNTVIPMALRGYEAFGVDLSPEMIGLARQKSSLAGAGVIFYTGDMREFLLERPVDLVTCFHDGLNYITGPEDLSRVFANTYRNLLPGGMFIFDLNAVRWIGRPDSAPAVIEEENMTIIYDTSYSPQDSIWTINLTCFVRQEGGLYGKFHETHSERGYDPEEVRERLAKEGFIPLAVYDAFSFNPPHPGSRRHFYAARRPQG